MAAGTIDSLNFEVLLDDKQFDAKIKSDLANAEKFNTQLSKVLDFRGKIRDTNQHLTGTSSALRTISQLTGVAFSAVGVRRFLSSLIEITGQFEVQKMALRNMVQDIDKADKIFEDLYNFSSKSTYRFSELAKYAKQLAAFSIESNDLLDTTKRLGDVASGIGVSMDRIILAYGHVKSSGFLRGIQLRSFAQNGVPVLEELSKMLTETSGKMVTLGDVFDKMTRREITFEMVEEAFKRMTSEGGKFYKMQEVLAKTLAGQINILKGKWENLMYAMGESQEGILKGVVGALTKIVSSTESFGQAVSWAIGILGGWKVASLIAAAATDTLTASQIRLISVVGNAVSVALRPYTLFATAIAATVGAIVKAEKDVQSLESSGNKVREAAIKNNEKYITTLNAETRELDKLYERVRHAKEGTEEYTTAKLALENRFSPYINQLKAEGVEVGNLAVLYDGLATKVREANKQRFLESAQESILGAKEAEMKTIEERFNAIIGQMNKRLGGELSMSDQASIWSYMMGDLNALTGLSSEARAILNKREKGIHKNKLAYQNYTFLDQINDVREGYESLMDVYSSKMEEAVTLYQNTMSKIGDANEDGSENVYKLSSIIEGIKKFDKDIEALRRKAKSDSGLTEAEKNRLDALVESREEQAKLYKSIMGVDYDKFIKSSTREQNQAVKDRIQNLKAEIAIFEKYRDAREKLQPYFGGDTNNQLATLFGGDAASYDNIDTALQKLISDLKALGEEGTQAAEQIEVRLGTDALGLLLKRQKALKAYEDSKSRWMTEEYGFGGGDGTERDVRKIVTDLIEANNKALEKYKENAEKAREAHKGDEQAIRAEIAALNDLLFAEREYNKQQAQSAINALARGKAQELASGFDMRDWGDKSIGQVRGIWRGLSELAKNPDIQLDSKTNELLTKAGITLEKFRTKTKEELDKMTEEAKEEYHKKIGELVQEVVGDFTQVSSAIQGYAEATGNLGLAAAAEDFSFLANMVGNFASKILSGDIIGAFSGLVTTIVTGFFEAKRAVAEFERELRAMKEEIRVSEIKDALNMDSIFGTNDVGKVRAAVAAVDEIRKHINTLGAEMPKVFKEKRDFWEWFFNSGLSDERYNKYSLEQLAESIGGDLYDAYGNLNADTLQKILDTYKNLGATEREWIEQAIHDSEMYMDAMNQIYSVMESLFGDIASQAADKIVNSWIKAGDAALDYADILNDVAVAYAKMITQSMLIDSVMTEDFKKQLSSKFSVGDTAGAMELIMEGMETMQALAPQITEALEPLRPYINGGGVSSDTLRDGINKELVEGNSSLIASYINAMRADLSVMRAQDAAGWKDVNAIMVAMPTLGDHLARIAAADENTARNTGEILAKFKSIITASPAGGSAVRTTK